MNDIFLFNSTPRSGNVFLTFLFRTFIDHPVTKCLEIEKYSDKSQKQAAFFRNPYDSISSSVVKSRIDCNLSFEEKDMQDIEYGIIAFAREYLEAIEEAKLNYSNIYIGRSEDMMKDPISTIENIATFFDFSIADITKTTNEEVVEQIKQRMFETEKTRVGESGTTIKENLMTDHDGHLPREKTKERLLLDSVIKDPNLNIVRECYDAYLSLKTTNVQKGQRWES